MSKVYEEEEKRMYLDAFNVSGKTKTAFARENNIILIQGYLDNKVEVKIEEIKKINN